MKVRVTVKKVIEVPDDWELVYLHEDDPACDDEIVKCEDVKKPHSDFFPEFQDKGTGMLVDFDLVPVYQRMARRENGAIGIKPFILDEHEMLDISCPDSSSTTIEKLDEHGKVVQMARWESKQ